MDQGQPTTPLPVKSVPPVMDVVPPPKQDEATEVAVAPAPPPEDSGTEEAVAPTPTPEAPKAPPMQKEPSNTPTLTVVFAIVIFLVLTGLSYYAYTKSK